MALPGLQRPCLESGRAWASALRRIEDRAVVELGRANGRAKVFREILAYLRGTVSVLDKRAVSSIGKRLGLTARCVRMHLAALERDGWVLRVHHAGLRFPGQRGWATSAYVVPAALPHVSVMPLSRQAKARAELRVPAVAAALLAAGHARALRQAGAKSTVSAGTSVGSPGADNRKTSTEMGEAHPSVQASVSSPVSEITTVLPLPPLNENRVDNPQKVGSIAGAEHGCGSRRMDDASDSREMLVGLSVRQVVSRLESMGVTRRDAIQRARRLLAYGGMAAFPRAPERARGQEIPLALRRSDGLFRTPPPPQREVRRLRVDRRS